jgi:hypothetical protein
MPVCLGKIFPPPSSAVLKLGHVMHKVKASLTQVGCLASSGLIVEGALLKSGNFFTLVMMMQNLLKNSFCYAKPKSLD